MPAPHVFVAGPSSWNTLVTLDRLPEPRPHMVLARSHQEALGGTSAGKSLNLAGLGATVTLRTLVGADTAGEMILEHLTHERIELLAEAADGPSERHLNLMTPAGERLSIYLDLPDLAQERHGERTRAALGACDVAVLDLSEHSRTLLVEARDLGRPVWCDLHDYNGRTRFHDDFVEAADVLFLNDDGLADPLSFMRHRVEAGTEVVVLTQGAEGATAVTRQAPEGVHVPAPPVADVVDSNGAGDAFLSGFLMAHHGGLDLVACMEAGHRQAARCLRSSGLAPDPPTDVQVVSVQPPVPPAEDRRNGGPTGR